MKHTPAHTINVPDEYTDDKGVSYTVWPDVLTIDPRKDWWDDTNVGAHIFEPRMEREEPTGLIGEVFAHFYDRTGDAEEAERLTQRFVRVFAPNVTCKQVQIQGWSQSDWWNVFVWCNNGDVDAYAKELEQYFVGTVWVVESGDECICGLYADSMEEAIELFNENRG